MWDRGSVSVQLPGSGWNGSAASRICILLFVLVVGSGGSSESQGFAPGGCAGASVLGEHSQHRGWRG